jgi:hypothetical protein
VGKNKRQKKLKEKSEVRNQKSEEEKKLTLSLQTPDS